MNRVINACDKSVRAKMPKVIVIAAAARVDVLTDVSKSIGEWAHRSIQNVGASPIFVSFGSDADDQSSYHKQLQSGQELDCSIHALRVNVYSTLGSSVAVLEMTREDMTTNQ